ncbi:MKI67 FHA domain-interacting nucleolar phosphoprotein-like [Pollicipes pollicipes]|uniref:MKI67 FHA domain-interacting nucleolar phosphoprotein-like n=1 Tax=Pollicipes pollicipes TaxID=41117 RepID=UPI001884FE44|nr:MKI67 FHA domain-interacting nucleolar phosphoprotein-like [Pollicipes pollicipes]
MGKFAVGNTQPKDGIQAPASKTKNQKKPRNFVKTGVIYITHIPHGFYEDEMSGFFSQFGKVLRVCVARSSKTGNSKGYGYVQFMDQEVAKIAAETMNNYLMFEKIVKCKVLPPEQVTPATFASANRRVGVNCPGQKRTERSVAQLAARKGSAQRRSARKRREAARQRTLVKLAQLGIKYDLEGGLVQEVELPPSSAVPTVTAPAQHVLEVDESDDEVTFKTPPNTVRRRLSRPAASTPQAPTSARAVATAGVPPAAATHRSTTHQTTGQATPKSTAKATAMSAAKATPKSAVKAMPKSAVKTTPKSAVKMTPKTAKKLSPKAGRQSSAKKTHPPEGRQHSPKKVTPSSVKQRSTDGGRRRSK